MHRCQDTSKQNLMLWYHHFRLLRQLFQHTLVWHLAASGNEWSQGVFGWCCSSDVVGCSVVPTNLPSGEEVDAAYYNTGCHLVLMGETMASWQCWKMGKPMVNSRNVHKPIMTYPVQNRQLYNPDHPMYDIYMLTFGSVGLRSNIGPYMASVVNFWLHSKIYEICELPITSENIVR